MSQNGSIKPIIFAIFANSGIAVAKLAGFIVSGSSALLSEGIHSIADAMNQALLFLGIKKSQKPETEKYHFGFSQERFFWNLISAMGIFVLGCGVTVYHGIADLFSSKKATPAGVEQLVILGILLISLILEGISFSLAIKEIRSQAQLRGKKFFQYLKESMDPSVSAVFWEDLAAIIGILLAFAGIGLSAVTGIRLFDSLASILIGLLLGWIALHLAIENKRFLIDKAIPEYEVNLLLGILNKNPAVKEFHEVKTVVLGPDRLKFSAKITLNMDILLMSARKKYAQAMQKQNLIHEDLNKAEELLKNYDEMIYALIHNEVHKIENDLQAALPNLKHIDLEIEN